MIEIQHLVKNYNATCVVDDVSMTMATGTITAIVGTSGSGKSTLLRMINRLIEPTSGKVLINGADTSTLPVDDLRRRIGYVVQGYGLFPHKTVADNIATVPRLLKWPSKRVVAKVEELLSDFQLDPSLYAKKFPHQLSGGQQQRVGVARALAGEPELLLMDEPFGALDPVIRGKAQEDLLAIQRKFKATIVLVTHDMEEAFHLGDKVAVMNKAKLLQFGSPTQVLLNPADAFVEQLVGTADRPFRLLSLVTLSSAVQPGAGEDVNGLALSPDLNLRDALAQLSWGNKKSARVIDKQGALLGHVTLEGILSHARAPHPDNSHDVEARL